MWRDVFYFLRSRSEFIFFFATPFKFDLLNDPLPIPVSARSKAWVCGLSLAWTVGSNRARGHGCLSVVSVVCCQVEVFVSA
jgi:hypothetical protein